MRSNEDMPEPKVSRRDEHEQHQDDALTVRSIVGRSGFRVVGVHQRVHNVCYGNQAAARAFVDV